MQVEGKVYILLRFVKSVFILLLLSHKFPHFPLWSLLVELPSVFRGKVIYVHSSTENQQQMERYVIAFDGTTDSSLGDDVTHIVVPSDTADPVCYSPHFFTAEKNFKCWIYTIWIACVKEPRKLGRKRNRVALKKSKFCNFSLVL